MFSYSRINIYWHSFWHCGDKGCSFYFASLIITPSFWLDHDCSSPPPPFPHSPGKLSALQPALPFLLVSRQRMCPERERERGWGVEEIPFSSSRSSCLLHPSETPVHHRQLSRLQTQLQCQEGIETMVTNLKVNTKTTKNTHTHKRLLRS